MTDQRQIAALLRQAARAMPATERSRFSRYLRGLERRSAPDLVPGTPFLPAITVLRPPAPPKGRSVQPIRPDECDWHYGGQCCCGWARHRGPKRPWVSAPVQLALDLSHPPKSR